MTPLLVLNDVLVWSLQIGFLVGIAAILPPVLRLKIPKAKLAFWQLVLVSCLLLPLVRSWKKDVIAGTVSISTVAVSVAPGHAAKGPPLSTSSFVLLIAGAGVLVRFGYLLSGFRRLRRYRLQSQTLAPTSPWGVEADLRISDQIGSPVTFGFRKPVVLLPARFSALDQGMQDAILCHEILHVRRSDWVFTVGEEFVRALFWFHPAVWWLLREIQLVREQVVDREVVEMTRSRDQYIDALLVIAGAPPQLDLAPAPLFLRKRHLKQRIVSLMKEAPMSKAKSLFALAAGLSVLAVSGWFVTGVFPLQAAPQLVQDASGVSVETGGAQLMHREPVDYPRDAIAKGVQGTVVAQVRLDAEGNVIDASILSGPEELRKAVLQSVLNWHFSKDAALGTRQVSVSFEAPKAEVSRYTWVAAQQTTEARPTAVAVARLRQDSVLRSIQIDGLSDQAKQQLLSQLPVRVGDTVTAASYDQILVAVRAFDSHFGVISLPMSSTETVLSISPLRAGPMVSGGVAGPPPPPPPPAPSASAGTVPGSMRISGTIQSANLVTAVPPVYPPLARAAHVQGTVRFDVTIGKDGTVQDLKLLDGPPLLVQAAQEAVRQWVYKPTLLNGNPVPVVTTIEINFSFAE